MTTTEPAKPDYLMAAHHCGEAAEMFTSHRVLVAHETPYYGDFYAREGLRYFTKAAAALGYRLVAIEPKPVTSEPGFDNRHIPTSPAQTPPDGGRWNEHSTAQEA